jgi:hypothetical protein
MMGLLSWKPDPRFSVAETVGILAHFSPDGTTHVDVIACGRRETLRTVVEMSGEFSGQYYATSLST